MLSGIDPWDVAAYIAALAASKPGPAETRDILLSSFDALLTDLIVRTAGIPVHGMPTHATAPHARATGTREEGGYA
jgi:hypothetical protein